VCQKTLVLNCSHTGGAYAIIGRQVAISPCDQYLFVITKDRSVFMFSALVGRENDKVKYLMISET
ncbi:MAG: hypothetical protein K1562_16595, partial [Candidatus Thiodiazotropha sp. (ex. Lucinisca nassula)]|nr:hypothetical protein [Candidatus Thiodiazotropha sp. (ex. Lucinisca nassula)]